MTRTRHPRAESTPPLIPTAKVDPYEDLRRALLARRRRGRVLDVGCGDGALVAQLREFGFEAHGIDLREPENAFCEQRSIEDYVADSPFDAVVSRVALHHTANLGAVFERIHATLRGGGTFVMQEFDWTSFSAQTLSWVREHVDAPGPQPRTVDLWSGDAAAVLRGWAVRYGDLHARDALVYAADAFFNRLEVAPVPYLSWVMDRSDLAEAERAAIRDGAFLPLGFMYVGEAT